MPSQVDMIRQLKALPRERKVKIASDQTHAWQICQFHFRAPGERESSASFKINLIRNGKFPQGSGRCFSCSRYVPNFEAVIDPNKLESTDDSEETEEYVQSLYNSSLDPILIDKDAEEINLPNPIPWTTDDWRSIPANIMRGIGAKLIFDVEYDNLMAYLPCMVNGRHVGGIRANLVKKGKRNYYNLKGPWVKEKGLFPFDYTVSQLKERNLSTVVLVEGPRDCLKLLQYGIPALAILGTGNLSDTKVEMLINLNPERIIIAMDGDKVGREAAKKIHNSLKDELTVYNFNFLKYGEGNNDPGEADPKIMKKLRGYCI